VQVSANACNYFTAPIDIFFDEGTIALRAADRERLIHWLHASLNVFPYGVIEIESHAYADTKEKAQNLAQARTEYIKEQLIRHLPPDGILFSVYYDGRTSRESTWLLSVDMTTINLIPDAEKLGLPPCSPRPLESTTKH